MKVALSLPGDRYDKDSMRSWKLDIEKAFLQVPDSAFVPNGGGPGAILVKKDARNYNTQWSDNAAYSGTFTPTFAGLTTPGTPTYTAQSGYWRALADMVFFKLYVAWSAQGGAAGSAVIGGLPSTPRAGTNDYLACACRWAGVTFPANYTQVVPMVGNGANILLQRSGDAGVAAASMACTEFAASGSLFVSGWYQT